MRVNIIIMELRRNLRSFVIWAVAVCGMMFFGMMFYPAMNSGDLLSAVEPVFNSPMMTGLLSAFGADLRALSNLPGYYATYNSFYNILLGCIFASVLAGNLTAAEEREGTADFLFTRPVSRLSIFFSKVAVLFIYCLVFSIVFFLSSLLSMQIISDDAVRILSLSRGEAAVLRKAAEDHPDEIYEAFNLDDEFFAEMSMGYAISLLESERAEVEKMDLDIELLRGLLEEAAAGPEEFFESVLNAPEEYMKLFPMEGADQEEFLSGVRTQQMEYIHMRSDFFDAPELFLMFYDSDPAAVLRQFEAEEGSMRQAEILLELPEGFEADIFSKYSVSRLAVFCCYVFLVMVCTGSLAVLISLFLPVSMSVKGASTGFVLILYFIKSAAGVATPFSGAAAAAGSITPFAWIDTELTSLYYELEPYRILLFTVVSGAAITAAAVRLQRKDLLI